MKAKTYLSIFFVALSMCLVAQAPSDYYDSANGLLGEPLLKALHDIVSNDSHLNYTGLWGAFKTTDQRPDDSTKVLDIYSDIPGSMPKYVYTFTSDQCGEYNGEGDCYNREHLWPQSWFNESANDSKPRTDLHHIYPTDGWVNGQRGNKPFAVVKNTSNPYVFKNGAKLGASATSGYSGDAYEPIDEYKGDIARAMFYMSVRYHGDDDNWKTNPMADKSTLKPWAIELLLQWHRNDPVSQKEIKRNNAVHAIQGNRNPFVDNPDYAFMIWDESWNVSDHESVSYNVSPSLVRSGGTIRVTGFGADKLKVDMYDLCGRKIDLKPICNGTVVEVVIPSTVQRGLYLMSLAEAGRKAVVVKVMVN